MQSPGTQCGGGAGYNRFDLLAGGWKQAASWRQLLRKLGSGLVGVALVCGGGISAWADWTPPESSVTPPAVVTLDAFAATDLNGAGPRARLVEGPDGALYGSTPIGGTNGYGTLFRIETNGTFTKLHDFNGTDGIEEDSSAALVVGPDGALYGSTLGGGTNGPGTLFRLETNGRFTKLHDFNGTDGVAPFVALVVGPDGALYGPTPNGGAHGKGTLFRVETNGTFTKLHDFNGSDGYYTTAALVVGSDGALYGSTHFGGTNNNGYDTMGNGTLFRLQTNGTFTKLYDFRFIDGVNPLTALVVGPDGALYGSTQSGGASYNHDGTLFRWQTNGVFTKLHDFSGSDGANPEGLVVGPDGALYGSTANGGTNLYYGTLFRCQTNGTFSKLHDFDGTNGALGAALVAGPDGALYGSTGGGSNRVGMLFRWQTNGSFTSLVSFGGTLGDYPQAALVVGPDDALYGSTQKGGISTNGTLFRLETNGSFTKLHDFNGTDSYQPSAPLVVGSDGALYGVTSGGGASGDGTLFRADTSGTFTRIHDFNGMDGANPSAPLVVGPNGTLFGSTYYGGASNFGTLFRLETNGNLTKLHDFNRIDGCYPSVALTVGPDGALYGPAVGGANGFGTLFRVDASGTFTRIHDFNGTDGVIIENAALVLGQDGALYGSTYEGGSDFAGYLNYGYGTLFRIETDGIFTKLHDFNGTNDGAYPSASLVVGQDGALYGGTVDTLFRLESNGTFAKLHNFNGSDGDEPIAALVVGSDGALYGSTRYGGTNGSSALGYGTLFRMETDGTFTMLHDFNGTNDGAYPATALVTGPDGALYGSTPAGTLFRVETNGTFTKLYDFNGRNGANPSTALVVGPDGALYGSTPSGGPRRGGILFKLVLNRPPVARCHDVTVSAGSNCTAEALVDNGSFDPDSGDTITLRQEPPGPYTLGTTPVTLTVTDNHGASNSCTATVTVMDTTLPTISDVAVTPNVLWPPNSKMVEVTVNYTATDDCSTVSNTLFVTSNEVPNGGAPDWVIEDNHHVQLRAERSGTGSGRVYKVTVISTDNAGNSATSTVTVTVPKNHGK
jgi:uncharacterized repeat protein (TIGR03803 family)